MSDFTRFDENTFTATAFGASVGIASVVAASAAGAIAGIRQRAMNAAVARQEEIEAHTSAAFRLSTAYIEEGLADQELRAALEDAGIPLE